MRICSFHPAATEILCLLGLEKRIVGVSGDCDFPPSIRKKPVVVRLTASTVGLEPLEIDRLVASRVAQGQPLYRIDTKKLRALRPDLVVTQKLCPVCAVSEDDSRTALARGDEGVAILTLSPQSLEEIFNDIRCVGKAAGVLERAKQLVYELRERTMGIQALVHRLRQKPRVVVIEWPDPLYVAGHWVPEMVELAGGQPDPKTMRKPSVKTTWKELAQFNPEVIVYAPCGFSAKEARQQAGFLKKWPGGFKIKAFQDKRIYAVNANAYMTRPGPRVVGGVALLAHLCHPKRIPWTGPKEAFYKIMLQ